MITCFDDELAEKILAMPEYKQGTNKIRVTLKDGKSIAGVYVAWGREIIKVDGFLSMPFDIGDVADVENDL